MRIKSILCWIQQKLLWVPVYRLGCQRGIDPTLVLFAGGPEPGMGFLLLMKRLAAEGYDCRFFDSGGALKFLWTYARARAVFLDGCCLPVNACRPRQGAAVVQLRHGGGSFLGADAPGYSYTHISASAPEFIPRLAEVYARGRHSVVPWGMPHTDLYFSAAKVEAYRQLVLEALPEIGERKLVLCAPACAGLDWDTLAQALDADCALLTLGEAPPSPPEQDPFVFGAAGLPIEALLCAADLLLTEDAPLMYEYSLLGRPMLFIPGDSEASPRLLPGDLVWDTGDIIAGVRRNLFEGRFDPARVRVFRGRFMSACDEHSTERILHNILNI